MVDDIMISKKTLIITGAILAIVVFGTISAMNVASHKSAPKQANQLTGNYAEGEYQEATLRFENYEYVMEPSTLKAGIPVRLKVDMQTVTGCMRDIVISSFNVRKYVQPGDNTIEFTPDKSGTFWIVCSMNMGRGQFSVAEADGSASDYVEKPEAWQEYGGTCGGAGGCGCGGQ